MTTDPPSAPHGYGTPHGRRNGGLPSSRFVPPPSTNSRPLDVVWISGIYPDFMTTKADRTWKELSE
ncbi:hypothetical protein NBCG_00321 [Nocardioidaceae bacterium Broad-1]|nr:hypothetical protein NBCG_00321 [Nocardioidaceae bacterium Broad-1]